ncbi:MAG: SIS domain-containing protein [Flavobacteriales bacterium]|nr:SIS domain-containing protein [Flavobacteriales bacterium]
MYNLIDGFPRQLKEAIEIGRKAELKAPGGPYANVVVTGLGGSGIGGRIAAQLVATESKVPMEVFSNYYLPAYVNHKSLVIACSYSGNTEETLAAMEQALAKGARVVVITSGGTMLEIAQKRPGPYRDLVAIHRVRCSLIHLRNSFRVAPFRHHRRWVRRRDQYRCTYARARQGRYPGRSEEDHRRDLPEARDHIQRSRH